MGLTAKRVFSGQALSITFGSEALMLTAITAIISHRKRAGRRELFPLPQGNQDFLNRHVSLLLPLKIRLFLKANKGQGFADADSASEKTNLYLQMFPI